MVLNITHTIIIIKIVFIRTHDGNIWRSADEGKTWEQQTVTSKMRNVGVHGVSIILIPYHVRLITGHINNSR